MSRPTLYWISGSPPAWRVMLALVLKGVPFDHRLLDALKGENRAPEYLALNPKGQVPTLVTGDVVLRESLAILAWLDRAFPDRPIWGDDTKSAARVWQDVMLMEVDLRPTVTSIARSLLRNLPPPDADRDALLSSADAIAETLERTDFLGGNAPLANDIWLYPALHWIARGVQKSSSPPDAIARLSGDRPSMKAWMNRMGALPGIAETYPPHWR